MKVSVLLLTFNEASNLPRCLDALSWCDDVIVLDSGSTDGTVEIAQRYGARILYRKFDNFAAQRNFGIAEGKPRCEWILHLDADEVLSENFIRELLTLEAPTEIDAYNVPSMLILHGRWLRYAGMYPVYQVRLGRRDRLRFMQVGHGQREDLPADRIGIFSEPYLHFNFSHGLSAWLRKHIKYAEDEANQLFETSDLKASLSKGHSSVARRRVLKSLSNRLPLVLRPFVRAFYMIIVRGAFLDGPVGIFYVGMLFVYEAMIVLFAFDLSINGCKKRLEANEN